jgi:poly-gamma-glutamate synthesis protein (capsule biosynthesis protein)
MTERGQLCASAGLLLLLASTSASARSVETAAAPTYRLLFTGDMLLSREVAHEIQARRGMSPWIGLAGELHKADFAMGNLEGSVGDPQRCRAPPELCFADDPRFLPMLREAGFTAIGVANNHSGDLGEEGRRQTRAALAAAGVVPIGTPESPAFVRLGEHTVAIVALSLVPAGDGVVDAVPSWQIAQKLRLARALADWTIVFVHWGKELADWVVPQQREQAQWLIAHGADVIIGAHPHVVQSPECVDGRPVLFSLGNDVFDQKYAETKHGLIADCRIAGERLSCGGIATETPMRSSYPQLAQGADPAGLAACSVPAGQPISSGRWTVRAWTPQREVGAGRTVLQGISAGDRWRTRPGALVAAEFGALVPERPPMLITLERHTSSIDTEDSPRPYVYEVTADGLVARWRGSALAWPLLDARLLAGGDGRTYLCALHRGDSFLVPTSSHPTPPHVFAYVWNGFGFSGRDDAAVMDSCRRLFADALVQ